MRLMPFLLNSTFIFQFPLIFIEERNPSVLPSVARAEGVRGARAISSPPAGRWEDRVGALRRPGVLGEAASEWGARGPAFLPGLGLPPPPSHGEALLSRVHSCFCELEPFLEPLFIRVANCNVPCHPRQHPPLTVKPGPGEVGLHMTEACGWGRCSSLKGDTFLGSFSAQSLLMSHVHFRVDSLC